MPEPILSVADLTKYFPVRTGVLFKRTIGQVKAVDGVSFDLLPGETLGVVGESGCGKSTLAQVLMRLEEADRRHARSSRAATSFRCAAANCGSCGARSRSCCRTRTRRLNPRMTVGDIVGEPFEIHSDVAPKGSRAKKVQELLEVVGLNPEHLNRYPHQFSGGQRQRIGIARALALRPKVIICDEPVSALDVSIQAQVMNLLGDLQGEFGLSYVFIAHDLSVVRHLSNRVAVMYLGKIVEIGTDEEIYERPSHPYTQALLSAVPVADPSVRGQRQVIRLTGDVPSPLDPPSGCRFRTRCWKAQDRCATEVPELIPRTDGHLSACHFAEQKSVVP